MIETVRFLNSLAQALSTLGLYDPGHPSRAKVGDVAFAALQELQSVAGKSEFSFLDDNVVFNERALHEMRQWPWSPRLAAAGVQRVEFPVGITREDFFVFLNDLLRRLGLPGAEGQAGDATTTAIRYGEIHVKGSEIDADKPAMTAKMPYRMGEEVEVARWLYEHARSKGDVPIDEVGTVVRSLTVAMHGDGALMVPLLRLKAFDEYTAMHSINTSVLVMTFAETLGLAPPDVHAFGVAGLLHDIGMAKVPKELILKESLTPVEQVIISRHPIDGARILLNSDAQVDIAVTAAYEHHIRPDGTGYPSMKYPRDIHYATKLIQVCTVYDALRTARPSRPAFEPEKAVQFIEDGAGTAFDPAVARSFVNMIRRLEHRIVVVEEDEAIV